MQLGSQLLDLVTLKGHSINSNVCDRRSVYGQHICGIFYLETVAVARTSEIIGSTFYEDVNEMIRFEV